MNVPSLKSSFQQLLLPDFHSVTFHYMLSSVLCTYPFSLRAYGLPVPFCKLCWNIVNKLYVDFSLLLA
jgi:hypothetical protein